MTCMTDEPIEAVISRLRHSTNLGWVDSADGHEGTTVRVADLSRILDYVEGMTWRPIESAPWDQDVLVAWPRFRTDDEDNPTDEVVGVVQLVTRRCSGSDGYYGPWEEPDWLSGHGLHMDDDWCFGDRPSAWMPLPPPSVKGGAE